jgi:hypothetical protein
MGAIPAGHQIWGMDSILVAGKSPADRETLKATSILAICSISIF